MGAKIFVGITQFLIPFLAIGDQATDIWFIVDSWNTQSFMMWVGISALFTLIASFALTTTVTIKKMKLFNNTYQLGFKWYHWASWPFFTWTKTLGWFTTYYDKFAKQQFKQKYKVEVILMEDILLYVDFIEVFVEDANFFTIQVINFIFIQHVLQDSKGRPLADNFQIIDLVCFFLSVSQVVFNVVKLNCFPQFSMKFFKQKYVALSRIDTERFISKMNQQTMTKINMGDVTGQQIITAHQLIQDRMEIIEQDNCILYAVLILVCPTLIWVCLAFLGLGMGLDISHWLIVKICKDKDSGQDSADRYCGFCTILLFSIAIASTFVFFTQNNERKIQQSNIQIQNK